MNVAWIFAYIVALMHYTDIIINKAFLAGLKPDLFQVILS